MIKPQLIRRVLDQFVLQVDDIHGPLHWLRVAANGRRLARATAGADPLVVEHFALFHDSKRADDGRDRGHGMRAADFIEDIRADLPLNDDQLDALMRACADHEFGRTTDQATIGCCWDADRLDLSRLGIKPEPRLLSTAAAQDAELQAWAWERGYSSLRDREVANDWGLLEHSVFGRPARG